MAAPSNQTLIDLVNCYECATPGTWQLFKLGLLKTIVQALNPMADTSAQNLIDLTTCYDCPPFYALYELGLLTLIQQALSGGGPVVGGGAVVCGDADPVAAPPNPCAIFVNRNGGIPRVWTWDSNLNTWVNILA